MGTSVSHLARGRAKSKVLCAVAAMTLVGGAAVAMAAPAGAVGGKVYASASGTGGACSKHHPCSLATAAATASTGTTIAVANGTYDDQLTLTTPDITVQGESESGVVIQPTSVTTNDTRADGSTPVEAIVDVTADNVKLSRLTIDGSLAGFGDCGPDFAGVEYHDGDDGTIANVKVTNTRPADGITGCQVGDGIYVTTTGAPGAATTGVTMTNVDVDKYNKNGITCSSQNDGTTCTMEKVSVTGAGPTTVIAQNGIEYYNAGGSVDKATVSGDTYTGTGCGGAGCGSGFIILSPADGMSITNSLSKSSDNNIYVSDATDFTMTNTSSTGSTYWDGLWLDGVSGSVTGGTFSQNPEFGIGLWESNNVTVSGTTVLRNGVNSDSISGGGIYVSGPDSSDQSTSNTIHANTVKNSAGPGIWDDVDSSSNAMTDNTMVHNAPDAQDDGTSNTWTDNTCNTSSPTTGLCS